MEGGNGRLDSTTTNESTKGTTKVVVGQPWPHSTIARLHWNSIKTDGVHQPLQFNGKMAKTPADTPQQVNACNDHSEG